MSIKRRPLRDATAKAALARFDAVISKRYEAQLAGLSEEEYRGLEYLDELFQFLDEISEDEEEETPAPRRRAKRSAHLHVLSFYTTSHSGDS